MPDYLVLPVPPLQPLCLYFLAAGLFHCPSATPHPSTEQRARNCWLSLLCGAIESAQRLSVHLHSLPRPAEPRASVIGCRPSAPPPLSLFVGQVGLAVPSSSPLSRPLVLTETSSPLCLSDTSPDLASPVTAYRPRYKGQARPLIDGSIRPISSRNVPARHKFAPVVQPLTPPRLRSQQSNRTSRSISAPAQADTTHFVTPC
jgi:hypothetical protein